MPVAYVVGFAVMFLAIGCSQAEAAAMNRLASAAVKVFVFMPSG